MTTERDLSVACRNAIALNRYLFIEHKGRGRNVYPFSIKLNSNREPKLFAWCSLHPWEQVESFLLQNITDFRTSDNAIDRVFDFKSEF